MSLCSSRLKIILVALDLMISAKFFHVDSHKRNIADAMAEKHVV